MKYHYWSKSEDDNIFRHGKYWPDGVPETDPPEGSVLQMAYVNQDNKDFVIAYTFDQIRAQIEVWGVFTPVVPMLVTS